MAAADGNGEVNGNANGDGDGGESARELAAMSETLQDIVAPALPESVDEADLLAWHAQPGEQVARDQLLAEVETDKVVLEVVALTAGVLVETLVQAGEAVAGGQILGRMQVGEGVTAAAKEQGAVQAAHGTATVVGAMPKSEPAERRVGPAERRRQKQAAASADTQKAASTAAQKAESAPVPEEAEKAPAALQTAPKTDTQAQQPQANASTGDAVERVPMSRLRATIAKRMLAARQQTAMLTTFNEADMTALMQVRRKHKQEFEERHGVRLGFMSFFARAAAQALQQFPIVNAAIDGNEILMHRDIHIGVAVSSERGLVVPVLRHVDRLSLQEIEGAIALYGEKARTARLMPEDLQGGTFTISNGGVFGSLMSTPILNPPQSAVLGMHRIQQRPVVTADGEIAARAMMYLALSYDHRLIDGRDAVGFLLAIKDAVEDPVRLLLEV